MFARIRGTVLERELEEVVVDVGGVGYLLYVSLNTLAHVGPVGTEVDLRVHTQVREDAITLFGFASAAERDAFRALIGVSGVGPRIARAALSALSTLDLAQAIRTGDVRTLTRVPGIGKRTAERIIVELKDTFPVAAEEIAGEVAGGAHTAVTTDAGTRMRDDVETALSYMGYRSPEIRKALKQIDAELERLPLEELIRLALARLQGRKA